MLRLELDKVLDVLKVLDTLDITEDDNVDDSVDDSVDDIVLFEGLMLDVVDTVVESVDETVDDKLGVTDGVTEAVEEVTKPEQVAWEVVIVSSIKVIPPVRAYRPPWDTTALSSVMLASARMSPTKLVAVPSVALLPTAQVTPQGWAPLTRRT